MLISLVSAGLVLFFGLVFLVVVKPGPVKNVLGGTATTSSTVTADPTPSAVLAAATESGVAPDAAKVKAALDPLVSSAALGSEVHVSVVDVASSDVLYARLADVPSTPASTTKLLTAATALAARGPAYRISTTAVAGSASGEVVLVGGGDPTLSVNAKALFPGAARLDELAAQVKTALGGVKPTRVTVDTSLFSGPETATGWASDDIAPLGQVARVQSLMTDGGRVKPVHNEHGGDPRFPDPAIAAGQSFAKLLGVPTATVKRGKAPAGAAALGEVRSPPLVQITDWMLAQSDNAVAEVVARQVALAAGRPASFDGATDAIIAKLKEFGLPGDEADLYDGSGLSRNNGISPTLLTGLLALAARGDQPATTGIFSGLPVAGWSGTLDERFARPKANQVARGIVRAKTGTLSGVNTMAGQLTTADGRLLAFAIMASGSASATTAKAALDRVPARLVICGC
ncbi:D-alanyl-D-alanine carboxypeptidase/D-alanyl-D-alanine endopeptidase [Paractinoplanes toevensis]|uniref:D-alanyl-D-alanine carboxypeptidase n=1 Tax=Paractinoplanes toevensis TaxID=571911 RepID=A0A920BQI7_9ACTN|nr:D-alanyl-D-alanine carboxypeptidase/D-alanyl-D-alanine-endopeptidase [Actinoplanes toevensis]GIM97542.1 D-alanyl-D-alanine carboxypeptidase [Actinoplanes toevensis]